MKVLPSSGTGVLNRGLTWTGDTLDTIADALDATRSETFGYSATRRLTSASGRYGAMSWTYDAVGNRASEVSGGTTKTYTTPATSNRLSTVTQGMTTLRNFGYDAAGAIATDAKAGVTWTSTYAPRAASFRHSRGPSRSGHTPTTPSRSSPNARPRTSPRRWSRITSTIPMATSSPRRPPRA